ncbi:hypothetical protein, partial [uncultured Algoriphagus sp.]|uniref:hypothetical protein n=1 Tax=uncultured Algoriphagus sp. TaxID=417365 RepID=UPI0025974C94
ESFGDGYRAHLVGANVVGIDSSPYNLSAKSYDWAGKMYLCDCSDEDITVVVPSFALAAATPFTFGVAAKGGSVTVRFTGGGFNGDPAASGPYEVTDNSGDDEITISDGQWAEFTHSSPDAAGWSIGRFGGVAQTVNSGSDSFEISSLPVTLTGKKQYGAIDAPITSLSGADFSLGSAEVGAEALIYFEGSADPFNPTPEVSGQIFDVEQYGFDATRLYIIRLRYQKAGRIEVRVTERAPNNPVISSLTATNSAPPQVNLGIEVDATYVQDQALPEDVTGKELEVWFSNNSALLTKALILDEGATVKRTKRASFTGSSIFIPDASIEGGHIAFMLRKMASGGRISNWEFGGPFGAVAAASSFRPENITSALTVHETTAGDQIGADGSTIETINNLVDNTGSGYDFIQSTAGNRYLLPSSGKADRNGIGRYFSSSWVNAAAIVAANVERYFYFVLDVPDNAEGKIAEFGSQDFKFYTTAGKYYIDMNSSSLRTAVGSIAAGKLRVRVRWWNDGTDNLTEIAIVDAAGAVTNAATRVGTWAGEEVSQAAAFNIWGSTNSFHLHSGIYGASLATDNAGADISDLHDYLLSL